MCSTAHLGSGEGLEGVLSGKENRTVGRKLTFYTKEHSAGILSISLLKRIEN